MLAVRENSGTLFPDYLLSPDPFGYFRPLPKLFYYIIWNSFHNEFYVYRIFVTVFHIINVILIYKLTVSLDYGRIAAFIAALLFSVLTCHTEALYFINCINELFSAFFILSGLYMYSCRKYEGKIFPLAIIILFLSALLSKESAVCYIPLLLLIYFFKSRQSMTRVLFILITPLIIYASVRLFSEMYFSSSNLGTTIASMDLNPLKIFYKVVHYFIMMLFPVKVIFEFLGFENLEYLIKIYRQPGAHLPEFITFTFFILSVLVFILFFTIRKVKSEIFFPVLFTIISLSVYLFSFATAERYSYLASAGLCLLIGILYVKTGSSGFVKILFVVFISMHLFSLIQRSYRYRQAADFSRQSMINLNDVTMGLKDGSDVMIISLPPKQYGIYFLNVPNFHYNWRYNFPQRKINFEFEGTARKESHDAVYDFDIEKSAFVKIK